MRFAHSRFGVPPPTVSLHGRWNRPSSDYVQRVRKSTPIGIVFGLVLGVPIGLALDSIGMGIGIGLALAIAAGWLLGDRE